MPPPASPGSGSILAPDPAAGDTGHASRRHAALRISLIYALISLLWILFSDRCLHFLVRDDALEAKLQTAKGLLFVAVTAVLLYLLIRRHTDALERSQEALRQSERRHSLLAENRRLLLNELDHRVKNNLAGLFSLISLYAASSASAKDFADAVRGKIWAMKTAHEAIAAAGWSWIDMEGLLKTLAGLFVGPERPEPPVSIQGPAIQLPPRHAGALAMITQELLTNSRKHGALAREGGAIELTWRLGRRADGKGCVEWVWQERSDSGAPALPRGEGVGLDLIEGLARHDLGGECDIAIEPGSFQCVLKWTPEVRNG